MFVPFMEKNGHTENTCIHKIGFPNQENKTYKFGNGNNRKLYIHCNKTGHTVDTCYKMHGYPPWYKFYNCKTSVNNIRVSNDVFSKQCKKEHENGDFRLTAQQYQAFPYILKQNTNGNFANQVQVN